MTLNQISMATGNTGFQFKSTVTGKKFKVLSVTPAGKFLVQNLENIANETLLDGQSDRYEEFVAGPTAEQLKIKALKEELEEAQSSVDHFNDELDSAEERILAITNELVELGCGDF